MQRLKLSKKLIEQIIDKIRQEVDVEKIVIFGSQVRDDRRESSDIDIALFGVKGKRVFLLKDKLNEELDTLRDIDLIVFDNLKNEELKKRILKEGVVIYERGSKR